MDTTENRGQLRPESDPLLATTGGNIRIGRIVAGSLAAGLATAAFLVLAPFITVDDEDVFIGLVLLGFALGWALLAVLSTWWTDQPQRWAAAPAVFMAVAGTISLLAPDAFVHGAFSWVWPPALLVLVVWVWRRARRDLHSRSRRVLVNPVLVLLALASLAAGYETVRESFDARTYAMPGRLVNVGNHSLHLNCTGSRGPTVVLEPGAGEMSSYSGWIAPAVARDTRVCVYDRAGRGWSEPSTSRQDGVQIATDLHTLLHRARVPGPYVLAGHSFGGLYVMVFADRYPDEVAGMVLVDSTAPSSAPAPADPTGSYDVMARVSAMAAAMTRLGVGRLVGRTSYADLPPQSRDEARARSATASQAGSWVDEYAAASWSTSQAGELTDLGAKPLVVLTAGSGSAEGWMADQDAMASLSTNSVHRVVAGATHGSLMEDRDDATAVSQAVHDVVVAVRSSAPLPIP